MILSIIIPVLNEQEHIRTMINMIDAAVEVPHEILVVCDSRDDTTIPEIEKLQVKKKNLRLIMNFKKGVANAIKQGAYYAKGKYILFFAADEAGPVLSIDKMLLELSFWGHDLVSATRYSKGGRRLGGNLIQSIISRIVNRGFLFLGYPLSDATTGIKMVKTKLFISLMPYKAKGWEIALEISMKAYRRGFKLSEVPIISIDRLYGGRSNFSFKNLIDYWKVVTTNKPQRYL